jgi:hypothetical protein
MAWRKWVVRGLVFAIAAALGAGWVAYQHWTDPAEVRRQVLAQLSARFPGANVTVESARLRLLGGIAVSELRMARRDDADMTNFLHVPSAIIYHDKEHLLGGKLAIRKMELERPRLRVMRDAEGRWNLADLLPPPDLRERIPTLIIKQGTIVVEDRRAHGAEPLEIKDVNLTVINDPDLTVTIEGCGVSDATGAVQLTGTWQRDTGRTTLTCDAPSVPVGPALVRRLSGACPQAAEHLRDLSGSGNLHCALDYRPGTPRPWEHDLTLALTKGKFSHPLLPVALEGITASFRCVNGHIDRAEAHAHAGAAAVTATVADVTLSPICDGPESCCSLEDAIKFNKLDVTVENLPVTESLINQLPEKYHTLHRDFLPCGPVNASLVLWHDGDKGLRRRLTLKPQRMSASFVKFPYPLDRITGDIVHKSGGGEPERLTIDLVGHASDQPVTVHAELTGTGPDRIATITVHGNNIPLDQQLLAALNKKEYQKYRLLAESFHPIGLANFHVTSGWRRDSALPEGGTWENHYVIDFHDATVNYDPFPVRLEKVHGTLIIEPDHWEFRKFEGAHGAGKFFTGGRSRRGPDGKDHVEIGIAGRGVLLDDDLRAALVGAKRDEWQRVWATFNPEGQIDFDGTVNLPPSEGKEPVPEIVLTVLPRGCRVTPKFFAYALDDLRGRVHYEKGTVELENVTAAHNATRVAIDHAVVQLKPGGGFKADLLDLHGDPLIADGDFIAALPEALRKAVAALSVQGPLTVRTRLYIDAPPGTDPPRIYWDGSATARDVTLRAGIALEHVSGTVAARGWHDGHHIDGATGNLDVRELTIFNQPIRNLRGQLVVTDEEPDVLRFPGLMAEYFGGQVYGPLRIELGPRPRYRLNLTAAEVKLEEFGRHNFNNTELNGLAVARVYLEGEGGELSGLKGNGRIDVPQGRMYKLPLLLDLLKFLGLRLPDRTFFEEAHAVFDIDGPRAHVKQLELYGNAISLRGSGDANIDGSDLAFSFNVDWARLGQVLPEGVRELPREISNQLFRIDMRGRVGDVHFREVPVPILTGPLRKMLSGDDDRWGAPDGSPKR